MCLSTVDVLLNFPQILPGTHNAHEGMCVYTYIHTYVHAYIYAYENPQQIVAQATACTRAWIAYAYEFISPLLLW